MLTVASIRQTANFMNNYLDGSRSHYTLQINFLAEDRQPDFHYSLCSLLYKDTRQIATLACSGRNESDDDFKESEIEYIMEIVWNAWWKV